MVSQRTHFLINLLGAEKKQQEAKDPLDSHKCEEEAKQAPTQAPDEPVQPPEETEEQRKKREDEEKRAKDIGTFKSLSF